MNKTTRLIPVFTLFALACSESSPNPGGGGAAGGSGGSAAGGGGGAPAGGSGGKSAAGNGTGGAGGAGGAGGTSGAAVGGSSGASVGGASGTGTAGSSGGSVAGTSSAGSGGVGGAGVGGSSGALTGGASGSGATAGVSTNAGAGGAAGQGQAGAPPMTCPSLPTAVVPAGDVIQFNDNGGWCWYQDERALVDTAAGKFVVGSVASGGSRDSDQEVVVYDIASGQKQRSTLQNDLNPDDHNAPAFFLRPGGGYAALWATHRDNCYSYYSTYNGSAWSTRQIYDWASDGCPWDASSNPNPPHRVTYANPWYLSAENKTYAGVRSVSTSPALLVSTDAGSSWDFYGRLSSTTTVGYVAGYYKYWGNGTDRIDFVGTEAHPRDNDNNLWHGYYKGGKFYNSTGTVVDDNAGDMNAQTVEKFTKVFATGDMLKGAALYRMWNHDIASYADGTVVITGQGRTDFRTSTPDTSDPDKRTFYSRWDGSTWKTTYLVKSGPKLYASEQDYTGLSAVDPNNPNVVFVSTSIDPRDDTTNLGKREIFMGVTCDAGATFTWAPITSNSSVDNIRPIVPLWDSTHTLLLWMKGTYTSAQSYSMQIVGTTALSTAAP